MTYSKEKNTGITLIALVITIVVLLILAGVTIVTLTGDNSLLIKTQQAKEENLKAEGREIIGLEVSASYDNHGNIDLNQLNKNLEKISGLTYSGKVINIDKSDAENYNEIKALAATVKLNGYEYKITQDGVVKNKILNAIEAEDIKGNEIYYYGKYITNYNSPSDDGITLNSKELGKWQIFMANENNIYLIASNAINKYPEKTVNDEIWSYTTNNNANESRTMNFSSIISKYTDTVIDQVLKKLENKNVSLDRYHKWMKENGTNIEKNYSNKRAVASMLDIDLWDQYCNNEYGEYAIGGPTLEMYCESYNSTHFQYNIKAKEKYDNGYKVQENDEEDKEYLRNLGTNEEMKKLYSNSCWAASPGAAGTSVVIWLDGSGTGRKYTWEQQGFRPVVCLKNNVYLKEHKDEKNIITYTLENY